jgi:threonylcarbamoyladenosine tRNA methylthiotransferase CDKAL1
MQPARFYRMLAFLKTHHKMIIMQVFVRSFGCSANTADSEVLAGCLSAAGFTVADSETNAQVVVYNSCAVKGPTENRIIDALKRVPKSKKVIVAGCLPLISFKRLMREARFDAVVGPALGKDIVDVVKRVLNGETFTQLQEALTAKPQLDLPRIQTNPVISVVPVNFGCLGSCAFCCVVHARGHLRSYSINEVVNRVKSDVASGSKEVWVTSQDTACYGREIGTNLAALLKAVSAVEGDFRVRVGMMTPNIVTPFLSELVEAFGSDKVFKFVHLPVQSGDDKVLRRMRRFYSVKEFKETVAAFRKAFPEITLSTDVICGFPGETAEAFENTLKLIREVQPDIVNVSKFFARPKTAAWEMRSQAIEKGETKRRSTETAKLAKQVSLGRNLRWVGWTGEILVDEKGKVAGTWVGRNFAYKPVTAKSEETLLGRTLQVKVVKAFSTHLAATIE